MNHACLNLHLRNVQEIRLGGHVDPETISTLLPQQRPDPTSLKHSAVLILLLLAENVGVTKRNNKGRSLHTLPCCLGFRDWKQTRVGGTLLPKPWPPLLQPIMMEHWKELALCFLPLMSCSRINRDDATALRCICSPKNFKTTLSFQES